MPEAALPLWRRLALLEWQQVNLREAMCLTPAMVVVLAAGLLLGDPASGAVAASGTLIVGFGAFQQFTSSRVEPMLFAAFGAGASTFIGTLAGASDVAMAAIALVYGFWCGMLPAIGMGAFWVGQQCTVFLLIAGAYSGGIDHALARTALVVAGGATQIAFYAVILFITRGDLGAPHLGRILGDARTAAAGLGFHLRLRSSYFHFALRFAVVLVAAVATERWLAIPSGYWVAMTALLLMRPDFQDTLARSLSRFAGTVAGAALATAMTHIFVPGPLALASLILLFVFFAYASLRLNYGVFSLFVTGYVVFLLVLAGVAEPRVAYARTLSTLIGGAFALAAHVDFYRLRRAALRRRSRAAPG